MGKVYSGEYYITTNEGDSNRQLYGKVAVLHRSNVTGWFCWIHHWKISLKTVSPSACVQLIAVAQHSYVYRIGQLPQSNYKTIFNTHWRSNQGTANDLVDIHEWVGQPACNWSPGWVVVKSAVIDPQNCETWTRVYIHCTFVEVLCIKTYYVIPWNGDETGPKADKRSQTGTDARWRLSIRSPSKFLRALIINNRPILLWIYPYGSTSWSKQFWRYVLHVLGSVNYYIAN